MKGTLSGAHTVNISTRVCNCENLINNLRVRAYGIMGKVLSGASRERQYRCSSDKAYSGKLAPRILSSIIVNLETRTIVQMPSPNDPSTRV